MTPKLEYNANQYGIIYCTVLDNDIPIKCHLFKDTCLLYRYANHTTTLLCRTADEHYYLYQCGEYKALPNKPTFTAQKFNEIVQLLSLNEVDVILEEFGVFTQADIELIDSLR